jgi:hypothetical protein
LIQQWASGIINIPEGGLRMAQIRNRRILWAIPLVITVCLTSFPAQAKYGGGSGTAEDPYQIATAADLIALGDSPEDYDKHFILTADIDLDPNLPGCKVFDRAVIARSMIVPKIIVVVECLPFRGDFDGNGHTIRNLFIYAEGEWAAYIGLFGCIEGHVRNIRLESINIAGTYIVGGLAGSNQGTITACSISGSITGQTEVGSVAGTNEGTISSCHTEGEVWADEKVGGLVGYHTAGTIAFSYSIARVAGTGDVGGLVGASEEGTVYLSYWDTDTSGVQISAGGRGKHSAEMMSRHTYRGWGYPKAWTIDEGRDYPRLLWEAPDHELIVDAPCAYGGGTGEPNDPFQIWSGEHLASIGYCPDDFNSCFLLMADIDLDGIEPNEIVPIGTARWPFRGLFDGNGHVISNLVCTLYGQSCVGLFGCLRSQYTWHHYESGLVRNLQLVDAIVTGGHLTGALVGKNEGHIVDCSVTGIVRGGDDTGGLVGHNKRTVDDCHYAGNVEGEANVGGLCGHNSWGDRSFVKSSSASGTVIGVENVGGLVGFNEGYQSGVFSCHASSDVFATDSVGGLVGHNNNSIQESYSTGNVTGQTEVGGLVGTNWEDIVACTSSGQVSGSTSVGGLVGYNRDTIKSCYATSTVSGNSSVGSLIGHNYEGAVTYCYACGQVVADGNNIGGLVGLDRGSEGGFFLCYWDIETSGVTTSQGGFGRATFRMMQCSTFRGWAQTNMWTILEGLDYPRLAWEQQQGQPITSIASPYGGGTGDPNDPYQIWTPEQFIEIAYQPSDFQKSFILMADIDLAGIDTNEVIPIGSRSVPFIGLFDGNGHTISNFQCVCPGSPCTGVFGLIGWPGYSFNKPAGATGIIANLSLVDAYVSGGSYTGGMVGVSIGQITNVSVTACVEGVDYVGALAGHNMGIISTSSSSIRVSGEKYIGGLVGINGHAMTTAAITRSHSVGTVNGGQYVGGLIGFNHNPIADCTSDCGVTGMTYVGGLIGYNFGELSCCHSTGDTKGHSTVAGLVGRNGASLCQCHAAGKVTADSNEAGGLVGVSWAEDSTITICYATGEVQGADHVGGLVGRSRESTISRCYSISRVTGQDFVGGLVGSTNKTIQSSYARGNVLGHDLVGGLVGLSNDPVLECYSTGQVSGTHHVGGLIGASWYREVESCFWDVETSGQHRGEGYHSDSLQGLTAKSSIGMRTAETFIEAGWDFVGETENGTENIWAICDGVDYPHLAWEFVIGDFDADADTDFADFCILAEHWLAADGSFWCGQGSDVTNDGSVNWQDLMVFTENWLAKK